MRPQAETKQVTGQHSGVALLADLLADVVVEGETRGSGGGGCMGGQCGLQQPARNHRPLRSATLTLSIDEENLITVTTVTIVTPAALPTLH